MKRSDLEEFLNDAARTVQPKYSEWLPALRDLYAAGLTTRELARLFPVSGKWLRDNLRGEGFKARSPGRRTHVPTLQEVEGILRKHRIDLAALPKPKPKKS